MSKASFWTEEKLIYLRENWGKLPRAEIARYLDCTIQSANNKAGRLGLRRKKEPRWTGRDIAFLRKNWGQIHNSSTSQEAKPHSIQYSSQIQAAKTRPNPK